MSKQPTPDGAGTSSYAELLRAAVTDVNASHHRDAKEKLRTILDARQQIDDIDTVIAAYRQYGQLCLRQRQFDEMQRSIRQAFEEAERRGDTRFIGMCHGFMGTYHYYTRQPHKAIEAYRQAIGLLQPLGDDVSLGLVFGEMARVWFEEENMLEAARAIQEAIRIFQSMESEIDLMRTLTTATAIYVNMSDYVRALEAGLESLALREKTKAGFGMRANLLNVGLVYQRLSSDDKARECYLRAIEAEDISDQGKMLARVYNNLGNLEFEAGNLDASITYLEHSLELKRNLGDDTDCAMGYLNLGQKLLSVPGKAEEARQHLLHAREIFTRRENTYKVIAVDIELAELALRQGDMEAAGELFLSTQQYPFDKHHANLLLQLYDFGARLNAATGAFEQAYAWQARYTETYRQSLDEEKVKALQEIEAKYQLEKTERDRTIARQEAEIYRLENIDLTRRVEEEIRKRQQQQEIIIQKSKLESIGRMAASMAHEIGQPLSAISMGVDIVRQRLQRLNLQDDAMELAIRETKESVRQIRGVMDDVRSFSRMQKADALEQVDVDAVIQKTISMCRHELESFDIELRLRAGSPGLVLGNSRKLQQVLLNLVANAQDAVNEMAQAAGAGYRKQITVASTRECESVVVEVTDNGGGMEPEHMKQVFEPFFTTKDESAGTGLGLSICYGIVRDMNGTIEVHSAPGNGTTMRIALPLLQTNEEVR